MLQFFPDFLVYTVIMRLLLFSSTQLQYLCILKDAIMRMLTSFLSVQDSILLFLYNCSLPKSKFSSARFCFLTPQLNYDLEAKRPPAQAAVPFLRSDRKELNHVLKQELAKSLLMARSVSHCRSKGFTRQHLLPHPKGRSLPPPRHRTRGNIFLFRIRVSYQLTSELRFCSEDRKCFSALTQVF